MSRLPTRDRLLDAVTLTGIILAGGTVIAILGFLLAEAWPVFSGPGLPALLSDRNWQPGSVTDPQFGVRAMVIASGLVTLLAGCIAIPLGVAGAVFQQFYAPPFLAGLQGRLLEMLAGVPSVIFGFWGLTTLVPMINRWHPPGQSWLAASLVLSLMILPTVGITARAAFQNLDPRLARGAVCLGMSRPSVILQVLLPAARGGLFAGFLLALTRAVGETLAVVMVCGNIARIPGSVFDPVRPVTATIALEMGYAASRHRASLYAMGLLLVVMVGVLLGLRLFWERRPTS